MKSNDKFKKWQKYQVLKKKRDLQKQANIYFKYTTEMLKEYKEIKDGKDDGCSR